MVAVNGYPDVILLVDPLLSRQSLDVLQQTAFSRLYKLGAFGTAFKKGGCLELNDDIVIAGIALGPLCVKVDLQSLFQPFHPCVAYFFLVRPLLFPAVNEVVALLGVVVHFYLSHCL